MITKTELRILKPLKKVSIKLYRLQIKSMNQFRYIGNVRKDNDEVDKILKKISKKDIEKVKKISEKLRKVRDNLNFRLERIESDIKFVRSRI